MTKDIIASLRLEDHAEFKTSCFRKNLFYDLFYLNLLDDPFKHLKDFIKDCLKAEDELEIPEVNR